MYNLRNIQNIPQLMTRTYAWAYGWTLNYNSKLWLIKCNLVNKLIFKVWLSWRFAGSGGCACAALSSTSGFVTLGGKLAETLRVLFSGTALVFCVLEYNWLRRRLIPHRDKFPVPLESLKTSTYLARWEWKEINPVARWSDLQGSKNCNFNFNLLSNKNYLNY